MMEKGFLFNYYVKSIMKIDSQNIRHAPYLVANSYFSHESILKQYGQNSYVSYLGVDTNKFKPVQSKEGDFILSVGLCTPEKGYDFIIRSLAKIEADIRPRLLIVSNQENKLFEEYLINLSRSKGVEIEIRNSVDDQELVLLYNQAQLVVFASYLEPFGLVPLEAMACGTPVLAVREGGMRESIIHNKTGVLTERDETLFAKAATHILEDPSYQEYLAKNSLKEVKNFWNTEMAGQRLLIHLKRVYDIEE
jgi:glycosyltransferase involved in cell wall biosynthesis